MSDGVVLIRQKQLARSGHGGSPPSEGQGPLIRSRGCLSGSSARRPRMTKVPPQLEGPFWAETSEALGRRRWQTLKTKRGGWAAALTSIPAGFQSAARRSLARRGLVPRRIALQLARIRQGQQGLCSGGQTTQQGNASLGNFRGPSPLAETGLCAPPSYISLRCEPGKMCRDPPPPSGVLQAADGHARARRGAARRGAARARELREGFARDPVRSGVDALRSRCGNRQHSTGHASIADRKVRPFEGPTSRWR